MEEANGPTTCLMAAAGLSASHGDGDGSGICLGNDQTEASGVPAESGRSGVLLRRMLPHPICDVVACRPYRSIFHVHQQLFVFSKNDLNVTNNGKTFLIMISLKLVEAVIEMTF